LRSALVTSEFALAFVLLTGAGLMIRSLLELESLDPGFDPHNVLSMTVSVKGSQEEAVRAEFYPRLIERLKALPGVESASGINHLPLAGDLWGQSFRIVGRPQPKPGESPGGVYRVVMPGYFETMHLPIRRGRAISNRDTLKAPEVAVINEAAAKQYWPGEDPIGQRIEMGDELTIVGISADAKEHDWDAPTSPEIYLPLLQSTQYLSDPAAHYAYLTLVVRTKGDAAAMANSVKQTIWSFDRSLPISEVLTMERVVKDANAQPRFEMMLLATFAAVALLLAAIGIYGVMSYSIARRTREIGIRISLGASRAGVLRMLVLQGMALVLGGTLVGIAGSAALSRLMKGMLYGVQPSDPITFAAVAIVLAGAALAATCIPARRAMAIEPMTALRHE
jgi:putative ABC transport system permease protein